MSTGHIAKRLDDIAERLRMAEEEPNEIREAIRELELLAVAVDLLESGIAPPPSRAEPPLSFCHCGAQAEPAQCPRDGLAHCVCCESCREECRGAL